jgi:hypothetical protein
MRLLPVVGVAVACLAIPAAAPARNLDCLTAGDAAQQVDFAASDGTMLKGEVLGSGPTGIVLSDNADQDFCQWLPAARILSRRGFRVLLFAWRTSPWDSQLGAHPPGTFRFDYDVAGAAALLRRLGSQTIVLSGAGIGGLVDLVAAQEVKPAPAAVLAFNAGSIKGTTDSLGDRSQPDDLDGLAAAKRLETPVLYVGFPRDSTLLALYRATPTTERHRFLITQEAYAFRDPFALNMWDGGARWARHDRSAVVAFILAHTRG